MNTTLDDILTRQAHSRDARDRAAAAYHPDTPSWCLPWLAQDSDPQVRAALARRLPCCPAHQPRLARDPDPLVRRAVADNLTTSPALRRIAFEFTL